MGSPIVLSAIAAAITFEKDYLFSATTANNPCAFNASTLLLIDPSPISKTTSV